MTTNPPLPTSVVLIIDDNAGNVQLLAAALKDQATTLFALGGEEGLKLAREHRPHLILLDIEMPGMNGYEVMRHLKADPNTRGASVLVITAHTSMNEEIKALEAGAVDFISKPFNLRAVQARVRTHLQLKHHADVLEKLATTDSLTGLANRRYVEQMLELEFQRHRRQQLSLALAMIDIDHFKQYNDNYGHPAGDLCLVKVAQAIRAASKRPFEVVGRYGGEEFIVILPGTTAEDAISYGAFVCSQVQQLAIPHAHSAVASVVTISVGLFTVIPDGDGTVQQVVDAADKALYQAKHAGRNRAVLAQDIKEK